VVRPVAGVGRVLLAGRTFLGPPARAAPGRRWAPRGAGASLPSMRGPPAPRSAAAARAERHHKPSNRRPWQASEWRL